MEENSIYLEILKKDLDKKRLSLLLNEYFQNLQLCLEEIIEGVLEKDFSKIRENLKTIQVLASSMYSPHIAEFSLLCESYAETGKESCMKEVLVLLFKQITLVKKECYDYM